MTAQHDRPEHPAPVLEWEQAWALADELRAIAAGLSPDVFDDAGWEQRRRLGDLAAAAESLGYRLAGQAVDRFADYVSGTDRPAELYRHLSDQAHATTAATRSRATRCVDRDRARDARRER